MSAQPPLPDEARWFPEETSRFGVLARRVWDTPLAHGSAVSPSSVTQPDSFDLCGPLPTGTHLLEASAGTGKTYAIAALTTRYIAEGVVSISRSC